MEEINLEVNDTYYDLNLVFDILENSVEKDVLSFKFYNFYISNFDIDFSDMFLIKLCNTKLIENYSKMFY